MRCLSLSRALSAQGWFCKFAVNSGAGKIVRSLASDVLDVHEIDNGSTALIEQWPDGADLLVVDHYGWSADFESPCRGWAQIILAIDDLANRPHDCDILLDQTFGRSKEAYRPLVPEDSRLLLGSEFALVRSEFSALRDETIERRSKATGVERIFVSLGGGDPDNLTCRVLKGIIASGTDAAIDVVMGSASPHIEAVASIAQKMKDARVHVATSDVAQLMARADIAVGASGTTSWERCCLGLPTLSIVIADNQTTINDNLEAAGAVRSLGWHGDVADCDVAAALMQLIENYAVRRKMSKAAAAICDGRGLSRVTSEITT